MKNDHQVTGYMKNKPKLSNKVLLQYLPHGIDDERYKPISLDVQGNMIKKKRKTGNAEVEYEITEFEDMLEYKKSLFGKADYDFVIFYNNRNIRRKMPGDIILAFSEFNKMLTTEQRSQTVLLMHTHVVDDNGTDLAAVKNAIAPDCNIVFSHQKVEPYMINYMYNIASVTINMASNEGYGLSTAESLMAGTPIIVNVTGGLQDQCGFVDDEGKFIDPEKHFNGQWGSNHDGKYKKHGKWVKPIFPTNRALVGSPPTPYIFDDRCDWLDAANAIKYWYDLSEDDRMEAGLAGREYMFATKMTANAMGLGFINFIDAALENWKPKKRFSIIEG